MSEPKRTAKLNELRKLERIIIDGVSGMDPEDAIGDVKVHYADGSTSWLVDVIEQANQLRRARRLARSGARPRERAKV